MVTYPNEWKILQWDKKPKQTNKQKTNNELSHLKKVFIMQDPLLIFIFLIQMVNFKQKNPRQQVWVSGVIGDDHYKRMPHVIVSVTR